MELTERRVDSVPRVAVAAAVVLAICVLLAAGAGLGRMWAGPPEPFEAEVVTISSDGDSLCLDRAEDTCGLPVILPEDRDAVRPGARVLVTELELDTSSGSVLAFHVSPLD